ncbi:MAG: carbohydrate ABC transporter permease [Gemmatimonadota bacterium]|nr:carbohydrate ABC transporter permease [Gemmatimonadota bacterium]
MSAGVPPNTAPSGWRAGSGRGRLLTGMALGVAGLVWLAPVLVMVTASLRPESRVLTEAGTLRGLVPDDPTLQNYRDVFDRVAFARILWNTFVINASIVVGGLAVNSTAAYALARLEWPGRRLTLAFVLALLVVPFEAIAVPLFYATTVLGWRDTYLVQILPFVANALSIYIFYTFFRGLPREVEDAARVDGAGPWRIFLEVVVPSSRTVFATVAIVTFVLHWGLYLWPLLVTSRVDVRPLPLGIATFRTLPPIQWGDVMAFAVMMVAPVALIFTILQRWFTRSIAATGLKG